MDFEFSPAQEAFRTELRGWLAANLPADLCLDDPADDRVASDRETFERRRAWEKTMHAAGWVGITWPKEYGGRGAGLIERVIWDEEYAAARAPVLPGSMGLNLVGPTIIHWGADAQKRRHLSAILNADEIWCQGFSEPNAGSDLASLRTRAVDRGDHYVVDGQKVWTSGAHFAHWIILLARTDPDAPKHQGISCLLVPMTTPGITVRPLVLMTGHHHFNEVFFTDVVVPKTSLLRGEPPGPEGSILKLTGSELGVRIAEVAGELLGMHVLVNAPSVIVPDAPRWFNRVLAARQYTISAGTSEIQRNIIGERVLGLPKG